MHQTKPLKISYKTYFNERLKQVDYHGQATFPLYVQIVYNRESHFFKSAYFELLSKPRYHFSSFGMSKYPSLKEVEEKEHELIDFVIDRLKDDFSLEAFKKAYAHYSTDLLDATEPGFIEYLKTFFQDEGMPVFADVIANGVQGISVYRFVEDLKSAILENLFHRMIENALYYSPPYLPLYFLTVKKNRGYYNTLLIKDVRTDIIDSYFDDLENFEFHSFKTEFIQILKSYFNIINSRI